GNFETVWEDVVHAHFQFTPSDVVYYRSYIHGDCCFSNILVSENSPRHPQILKFIDMRGSFGGIPGTGGDIRYDYAKLLHSSSGYYEYLINDLFFLDTITCGKYLYILNDGSCFSKLDSFTDKLLSHTESLGIDTKFL